MITENFKTICRYERQLQAFHHYSFKNYSQLELTNVRLKHILNNSQATIPDKQLLLNLIQETEHEIEQLQLLRHEQDKDTGFGMRVNATLSIISRLKPHLP